MRLRREDSLLLVVDVQEKLAPHVMDHERLSARCAVLARADGTILTLEKVAADGIVTSQVVLRSNSGAVTSVLNDDVKTAWFSFNSGLIEVDGNIIVPADAWQGVTDPSPIAGVPADGRDKFIELDGADHNQDEHEP